MNIMPFKHDGSLVEVLCPWLKEYAEALHGALVGELLWKEVGAGMPLVPPEDTACGLVGVVEGQVALRLARSSRLVDLRQRGFWCGRAGPVALTPGNLAVDVHRPSTLVLLPAQRVRALLEADPRFMTVFADLMSTNARLLSEILDVLAVPDLATRLARKIVSSVGTASGASLMATQQEIAEMMHVSRNRVNRTLMDLEQQAAIKTGYGRIVVNDEAILQSFA